MTRVLLIAAIFAGAEGCKQHRTGSVVGSWIGEADGVHVEMTLNPDNTWQMTGTGRGLPGTTLTGSGKYSFNGTTLGFTTDKADVIGALPEEQRAAVREKILAPQPDNRVDFTSPDQFVETSPDGSETTFKRKQ